MGQGYDYVTQKYPDQKILIRCFDLFMWFGTVDICVGFGFI